MESHYKKIYTGPMVNAKLLENKLKEFDISPIIKDDTESGRLAGFAPPVFGQAQVFVHEDEYSKAHALLDEILDEIED
ncbi:putative signal transducing protein [Abyssalbus ytuae]|uniref:DUF2007 domain-containing protein n=1 Tax=Abyssalbus ytuae TaxID=2926907 RepID=A0A9E7D1D2_9FLAO|nr:DUF2007 domain-containing protein [Abyssalbus ytuae]UOB16958.1 DUF2007 domain-containing protein [Abyssalbus ytuae]